MNAHGVLHIVGIPAPHHHSQGDPVPPHGLGHPDLPLLKGLAGDGQPPEPVPLKGIRAGNVEDKIRTKRLNRKGQRLIHGGQKEVIRCAVRKGEIQIPRFLVEREVGGPMHGHGQDRGVVSEDVCRSIALMDVQIEDGHALDPARGLKHPAGYGHIIEDAKPLASVGKGMVRPSGQVHGGPGVERGSPGLEGPTHGSAGPFHKPRRPRKPDPTHLGRVQLAAGHAPDIAFGVDGKQVLVRGGLGEVEGAQILFHHPGSEPTVLLHRKSMPGRQRKHKGVTVKNLHDIRGPCERSWGSTDMPSVRTSTNPRTRILRPLLWAGLMLVLGTLPPVAVWGWVTPPAQVEGGIDGRVVDESGRPLRGVTVRIFPGNAVAPGTLEVREDALVLRSALTDETGFFRAQPLPAGEVWLQFLSLGFAPALERVQVPSEGRVQIQVTLRAEVLQVQGIEVEGLRSRERTRFETEAGVTLREVTAQTLRRLPGLAETDPVRALEFLPGVVAPTDFSAAFHVRGGSSDQNLILLDGFPIFNPFHLGGVFSVFNADLVDRVELASGGFPAAFGGRVSSVLRVESDPGDGTLEVEGGVSLLAARATVSGALPKRMASGLGLSSTAWKVAGRRSYVDQILRPVTGVPYHVADLQGVMRGWTSGGSRWTLTGYGGEDVLDLGRLDLEDFPLRVRWTWGNRMVGAEWLRGLAGGGALEARAGWSYFGSSIRFADFGDVQFDSRIHQVILGGKGRIPVGGRGELSAGVQLDHYQGLNLAETGGTSFGEERGRGWNHATFLQGRWQEPGRWTVEGGLRLEGWHGNDLTVVEPTPRLAVRRFVGRGDVALKASVGRYAQFVQSVRDEEQPLGIDFWVTAGSRIPGVLSDQAQVGFEVLRDSGWSLSSDVFVREFRGVISQNPVDDPNDPEDRYLRGTGTAYGIDAFLERRTGRVQGSLSLSYLKADRTFPDVFSGRIPAEPFTYPPVFDRRLDADLVLRFPLGRGWDGGLRWHVGSGITYTRPVASYPIFSPRQTLDGRVRWRPDLVEAGQEDNEGPFGVILGPRNGERYPTYHRLDVSARKDFRRGWGTITPFVNILNVYNQKNVLFYFFDFSSVPATRSGLTMFPFLPTVGFDVRFGR